ncbi:MAG TPA: hypothetical protein ENG74_01070 [Thermoplasmatales archaeon]|nr:hypothetical protein [Thermoplasmatales archaeon]
MVRYRWFRSWLKEIVESTFVEKVLLMLPFVILVLDLYMLNHALHVNDVYVIMPATLLFIFSVAEIVVALDEIHEHAKESILSRKISSRVRSLIKNSNEKLTVKRVMALSLEKYPELKKYRKQLYHIVCQTLAERRKEETEDRDQN